jgi:hypothetical protein
LLHDECNECYGEKDRLIKCVVACILIPVKGSYSDMNVKLNSIQYITYFDRKNNDIFEISNKELHDWKYIHLFIIHQFCKTNFSSAHSYSCGSGKSSGGVLPSCAADGAGHVPDVLPSHP